MHTIVFLLQASFSLPALGRFFFTFALIPVRYFGDLAVAARPETILAYLPFLSDMFLQKTDLILNMRTLWVFSPVVGDRLGSARYYADEGGSRFLSNGGRFGEVKPYFYQTAADSEK